MLFNACLLVFRPLASSAGDSSKPNFKRFKTIFFIMTTYYVITPFEPMPEEKFLKHREQIAKEGRKCIAIVFNCKDYDDFRRKYFGEEN